MKIFIALWVAITVGTVSVQRPAPPVQSEVGPQATAVPVRSDTGIAPEPFMLDFSMPTGSSLLIQSEAGEEAVRFAPPVQSDHGIDPLPAPKLAIVKPTAQVPPTPELGRRIIVCLKTQTLSAWDGMTKVKSFYCSTGKNNATPAGTFPIREKRVFNRALPKFGSAPIPYSLRLDVVTKGQRRLIAIHSHTSVPRRPASHGCIRLKKADAKALFEWAEVGTPVIIR